MSIKPPVHWSCYHEPAQRHRILFKKNMSAGVRKYILVCTIVFSLVSYNLYTSERNIMISSLKFYQDKLPPRPVGNFVNTKHGDRKSHRKSKPKSALSLSVNPKTHPVSSGAFYELSAPDAFLRDELSLEEDELFTHVKVPMSPSEFVAGEPDLLTSSREKFDVVENIINAQITSPRKSTYHIVGLKNKYRICDKIHVLIQARDDMNRPKTIGGDYFRAKIYNEKLNASSSNNGPIHDHGNGTYSAYFTLPWIGLVTIEVTLILPSEVIRILQRIYKENPYRMVYEGKFQSGDTTEVTRCHLHLNTSLQLCNFTDKMSGQPWFCEKPKRLPCSSWTEHHGNQKLTEKMTNKQLLTGESLAFQTNYIRRILKRFQPLTIKVKSNDQLEGYHLCKNRLPPCTRHLTKAADTRMAAGFYYKDIWHSNICNAKYLTRPATQSCLQNKRLYFYGDSTLRQWHNYLLASIPTLANVTFYEHRSTYKVGPLVAIDRKNNFTSRFCHHGLPIRNTWMLTKNIKYEANEIDKLNADANTIVVLNLWAHFTSVNLDDYRSRLMCVRNALIRLYKRSPGTLVIIKSANTRSFAYTTMSTINFNDWYVMKLDAAMRSILNDVPKTVIIDVWDMTNCHRTGSDVHPHDLVVREEIKILMSYMCSNSNISD